VPAPDGTVPLDNVAARFARACRRAEVDHLFVGGFAVVAWGQPRTTSDIDTLLRYGEEDVERLVGALADEDLETSTRDLRAALTDGSHVSVFTGDPILTVDIKPALDASEVEQIQDGVEVQLDEGPVSVAPPADTVVFKVLFGSEQDLQDARSILARQGDRLDRERLGALASRHGVGDEVDQILAEVEAALEEDGGSPTGR